MNLMVFWALLHTDFKCISLKVSLPVHITPEFNVGLNVAAPLCHLMI